MIWIDPERLSVELNKSFKFIYILFGNDLFYLQNSQLNIIRIISSTCTCIENINIKLKNKYFNWNEIFNLCKINSLFTQYKILSLHFFENYPIDLLNENIPLLYSLINDNLILILLIHTSNQFQQQHRVWIKFCNNKQLITLVNCMIPNYIGIEKWLKNQSKHMKMTIENSACQLLFYYYEGNHALLYQTLQYLSLIYPDGNLNYLRVKNIITDSAFFNPNHWIEAILLGNKQRANRVLKKLIYINSDLYKLLRKIQHEILITFQIKHGIKQNQSLYMLFNKYKVYTKHQRIILSKAVQRLDFNQLAKSISFLTQIELKYYTNNITLVEMYFLWITEILCENYKNCSMYNAMMDNII